MAYPPHEKPPGQFEEGIEPVFHQQYGQYPGPPPPPPPMHPAYHPGTSAGPPRTTGAANSGMGRKVCWLLVCLIVLLLALAIGLGAGLGTKLAQANSRAASTTSTAQVTVTYTPTSSAPTATFTAASSTTTPTIPCPSQNLTLYTSASSVKAKFRLYCGFDFSGSEADDLANVNTASMEACMDVCASTDECQGAGWGSTGGPAASAYACYLKTNLTTAHNADDTSWCFALNLNTTTASVSI